MGKQAGATRPKEVRGEFCVGETDPAAVGLIWTGRVWDSLFPSGKRIPRMLVSRYYDRLYWEIILNKRRNKLLAPAVVSVEWKCVAQIMWFLFFYFSSTASAAQQQELQPQQALQKSVSNLQKQTPATSQEVGVKETDLRFDCSERACSRCHEKQSLLLFRCVLNRF